MEKKIVEEEVQTAKVTKDHSCEHGCAKWKNSGRGSQMTKVTIRLACEHGCV